MDRGPGSSIPHQLTQAASADVAGQITSSGTAMTRYYGSRTASGLRYMPSSKGLMALKVIGAGFGRTGTLSLKAALEQLDSVPVIT